jgi:hypothetical protein
LRQADENPGGHKPFEPHCFDWDHVYDAAWAAADAECSSGSTSAVSADGLAHLSKELLQGIPVGGGVRPEDVVIEIHGRCIELLNKWEALGSERLAQDWAQSMPEPDDRFRQLQDVEQTIRGQLSDLPAEPVDIINAGWLSKFSTLRTYVRDIVALFDADNGPNSSAEATERLQAISEGWCKYALSLDHLLMKSLEIASILRFYMEA